MPAATAERVKGMVEIRDTVRELIAMQMEESVTDEEIHKQQEKLNQVYDAYTAKYGVIGSNANKRAFSDDASYCLLCSLEDLNEDGTLKRKADMFTKRTIKKAVAVTSVETATEALALSLNERAKVDLSYMAQLTGKTEEKITEELVGVIFKNPLTDQWESGDEYLSGNVREKLNTARTFAENHPEFTPNVRALEAVQPRELEASEIEVRIGATWIEPSDYQDFMRELLHTPWYLAQKEIDDKVLLEYYKLEKDFEGPIELESTEGGYTPISGDSGHREPKKDPLTVIIDKINEKYGTHFTEMDKVLVQMENDYANQEKWQSYAKNNDRATFMLLFEKDFPNMAADRYEQNDQFFRKLFDDPDMMRQVMETVGSVLYERLKKKYIFDPKSGVIEEATPETYVEDTYLTKK